MKLARVGPPSHVTREYAVLRLSSRDSWSVTSVRRIQPCGRPREIRSVPAGNFGPFHVAQAKGIFGSCLKHCSGLGASQAQAQAVVRFFLRIERRA